MLHGSALRLRFLLIILGREIALPRAMSTKVFNHCNGLAGFSAEHILIAGRCIGPPTDPRTLKEVKSLLRAAGQCRDQKYQGTKYLSG